MYLVTNVSSIHPDPRPCLDHQTRLPYTVLTDFDLITYISAYLEFVMAENKSTVTCNLDYPNACIIIYMYTKLTDLVYKDQIRSCR